MAVLIGMASCQEKEKEKEKEKETESFNKIQNLEKLIRDKKLDSKLLMQVATSANVLATVVIDKTKIPSEWLETNVFEDQTNDSLVYAKQGNYYYVNLTKIDDIMEQAKWLEYNTNNIEYESTRKYVETAHQIHFPELVPELLAIKDDKMKKVRVGDLLSAIGKDTKYPSYIKFNLSGKTAVPVKKMKYAVGPHFFSAPMLMSIINSNKLIVTDSIGVESIKQYPHDFTTLKIIGQLVFYNYSNEPR